MATFARIWRTRVSKTEWLLALRNTDTFRDAADRRAHVRAFRSSARRAVPPLPVMPLHSSVVVTARLRRAVTTTRGARLGAWS